MSENHPSSPNSPEVIKNYLNVSPADAIDAAQLRDWALTARETESPFGLLMAANMFYERAQGSSERPDLLYCQLILDEVRRHNPGDMVRAQVLALRAEAGLRMSFLDPNNDYRQSFMSYQEALMQSGRIALKGSREAEDLDSVTVHFINRLTSSLLLAGTDRYIGLATPARLSTSSTNSATAWSMRLSVGGRRTQLPVRTGVQPGLASHLLPPKALLHEEYQKARKTPFGTLQAIMDATERNERLRVPAQAHVEKARASVLAQVDQFYQPRDIVGDAALPVNYQDWYQNLPPHQPYLLLGSRLDKTVEALQKKLAAGEMTHQDNLMLGWVYSERADYLSSASTKQASLDYKEAAKIFSGLVQNTRPTDILHYQARLGRHAASIHSALQVGSKGVFKQDFHTQALATTAQVFLKNYSKLNPEKTAEVQTQINTVLQTLAFGLLTSSDATESCITTPAAPRQHHAARGGWHINALPMSNSGGFKTSFAAHIRIAEDAKTSPEVQAINEGVVSLNLQALIKEVTPKRQKVLSDFDFLQKLTNEVSNPEALQKEDFALLDAVHTRFMKFVRFAGML